MAKAASNLPVTFFSIEDVTFEGDQRQGMQALIKAFSSTLEVLCISDGDGAEQPGVYAACIEEGTALKTVRIFDDASVLTAQTFERLSFTAPHSSITLIELDGEFELSERAVQLLPVCLPSLTTLRLSCTMASVQGETLVACVTKLKCLTRIECQQWSQW